MKTFFKKLALSTLAFMVHYFAFAQCTCFLDISATHKNAIQNCINGSITVMVNGNICNSLTPVTITLKDSATQQFIATEVTNELCSFVKFENVPTGGYMIIATHPCSAPDTCFDNIPAVPSNPTFNAVSTDIYSHGCNDGTIGIEITGDYCPLTLKIECHDTLAPNTIVNFTQTSYCSFCFLAENLHAGVYKIEVSDTVTLIHYTNYVTINEPVCNFYITAEQGHSQACTLENLAVHLNGDYCLSNTFTLRLYNSLMKLKDSIIDQLLTDTVVHFNNLTGGTYTVIATYANSCTSSTTATVKRNCAIPYNLIDSTTGSDSRLLTWSGYDCLYGYDLYYKLKTTTVWQKISLNGYSDTSAMINNLTPGATYQWKVRSKCTASLKSQFTSIKKFTLPFTFRQFQAVDIPEIIIKPNPVADIFTVSINADNSSEITQCLLNSIGEIIYYRKNCSGNETYSLAGFPKGVYLLKVEDGQNVFSRKLVH